MPLSERDDFDSTYSFPKDYDTSGFDLLLSFQSEWGLKVNAATVELQLEPAR